MNRAAPVAILLAASVAAAFTIPTPQETDALLSLRPDGSITGPLGSALTRLSPLAVAPTSAGGGIVFNGVDDAFRAADQLDLPREAISVEAWVAIEMPQRWGGIVGAVEDNGEFEKGWILGYDGEGMTFMISTEATNDGDGKLVTLRAPEAGYPFGQWVHVAATYDGEVARLFVGGAEQASSDEPGGSIVMAASARVAIGGYFDTDEAFPHDGRIDSASIYARALTSEEIQALASESPAEGKTANPWTDTGLDWRVLPYLTWPRPDGVSVLAETTSPATATLRLRTEFESDWRDFEVATDTPNTRLHEFRPEGLEPDTKYFYQVLCTGVIQGPENSELTSEVRSFRTAPKPTTGFEAMTFTVISDTQTQGDVAARVTALAHEHRPDFVVHCGDLVDTGGTKSDWTETFFPNIRPLIEHAPMISVLGNHEQDARNYYDYMSLPSPEKWYSLQYGHAEFFLLDGNRSLSDQSEQLKWFEEALEASRATWRFVVLHHPPYTSDSNDYGETSTGPSTRGDTNVQNILALVEKHDVDICFSGHVHDYERTLPIASGKVTPYEKGGVIYITAAGAGGGLEDFDATNTWFGHKKMRRHHFVHVAIHGNHLELQAMDEDGRMFDVLTLKKRP